MKPSSATAQPGSVVAFPKTRKPRRADTEFLPAALEIIETPASPAGRAVALLIIAFLTVAIAWASYGQVDIIATAEGRIIPNGKSKSVQPFETGVVRRIAVVDGSVVKTGDVLVELDPTTDASDETKSTFDLMEDHLDIARLHALLDANLDGFAPPDGSQPRMTMMARRQMESQAAEHQAKIEAFDKQIDQKRAEEREIRTTIAKIVVDLPLLSEQRDIRQALLQNQYGSRLAYLQIQQQLDDSTHDLESQKEKQDETAQALAALDRQKAEADAEYRKGLLTDLAKAEVSASEHGADSRKAALRHTLRTLRAPVDGTVQQLAVHTLGGVVTPAQQLMVIVPKGTSLEIEAQLPNKDVGFVHKGQAVEIKVEAFTFTRYGLLHGAVTGLSQDAVTPREGSDAEEEAHKDGGKADKGEDERQAGQPNYVAHVSLNATSIATENGLVALEPGMAVTAEIKTGRRTVISYLLSPLIRFRQEGLRER